MKKIITCLSVVVISGGVILDSFSGNKSLKKVHDNNGKYVKTGSPGESTCSDAGCHGVGSGGLADNNTQTGGSVKITAVPAFTNNTYVPLQSYQITVTVADNGKKSFGFNFEALNSSTSTDLKVNNAVGTITNGTLTKSSNYLGTGRLGVTFKTAQIVNNQAQFTFTWKAPAVTVGEVNLWASGNAANGDNIENGSDNIYTTHLKLTPVTTGINEDLIEKYALSVFPNPIEESSKIKFNLEEGAFVEISTVDLNGKELNREVVAAKAGNNTFDLNTSNLKQGVYFVQVGVGKDVISYKINKK